MRVFPRPLCASIVFAFSLLSCGQLQAGMVYLALGDSNAFGTDESTPASMLPSYGDQGYVGHFADFLGSINGGVRPQVVNLAIPGELSTSFLTGTSPADWTGREQQLNLNYPTAPTSQNSLMIATLDAARAAGSSVYVTFNVGINDFRELAGTAAYQAATPLQQQALFLNLLNQVSMRYVAILTEVEMNDPAAHILLPGFFNGLPPTDPSFSLFQQATVAADQAIQQLAPAFGATYVDFNSIITANPLALANQTGAGHLNQAGYAAVALALDASVVPEPSSVLMLAIGVAGLAAGLARSRIG